MSLLDAHTNADILADVTDHIGTITLHRPDRRNAMSSDMIRGLVGLLDVMESMPEVRVVVLTGAGGAFCSGGDVQDFDAQGGEGGGASEVDMDAVRDQQQMQRDIVGRLHRYAKPTIAALPGATAGAGLGLALATDFRIASERVVMATAFGAVGLSGDFGVAWLLHALVGPARARELLLLNPRVRGEQALALGLVTELVPEDQYEHRVREFATGLVNGPAEAFAHMKTNLLGAASQSLEENMDIEVELHKRTGLTDDHINAIRAFVEKRTPTFGPAAGR